MKVKIELGELDGFRRKRRPGLPPSEMAQDRLEIAFVGKFDDECCVGFEDGGNFCQCGGHVGEVVHYAHHRHGVE